jgi:hypothetical protein
VSLRYRRPDGRPAEAVGELLRWSAATLTLRRRDGTVLELPLAAITHGRRVPPRLP